MSGGVVVDGLLNWSFHALGGSVEKFLGFLRRLGARIMLDNQLKPLAIKDTFKLNDRPGATAEIIRSNRLGGPERVIDVVTERAPEGFHRLEEVATPEELAEIVRGYSQLAGFAVPGGRERTGAGRSIT